MALALPATDTSSPFAPLLLQEKGDEKKRPGDTPASPSVPTGRDCTPKGRLFPRHLLLALVILSSAACAQPQSFQNGVTAPTVAPTPTALVTASPTATIAPTPTALTTASPTATIASTAPEAHRRPSELEVAFPKLRFNRMVLLTHAGDGTGRLFLVLQPGRILVFPNEENVGDTEVFLDIQEQVNDIGNEEGLLGLAFDPEYAANGFFYVYYSAANPRRSVVARFSVLRDTPNRANPNSRRVILEIPQPFPNHNGGNILFGPDGFLYIGLGDGGGAGDPQGNGQNPGTLLGSMLRIDPRSPSQGRSYSIPPDNPFVGAPGFREEIYAYGFRNPWRFSFDRQTGRLWAGDVGQNSFEEVDIILPGRNYGWNIMEGFHCFPPRVTACDQRGLEPPVVEYPLTGGNCAITGGHVYRGARLPSLNGAYVYGDFCSGRIWALFYDGRRVPENVLVVDSALEISSFGEDQASEMYILSFDGRIYRLKPPA